MFFIFAAADAAICPQAPTANSRLHTLRHAAMPPLDAAFDAADAMLMMRFFRYATLRYARRCRV